MGHQKKHSPENLLIFNIKLPDLSSAFLDDQQIPINQAGPHFSAPEQRIYLALFQGQSTLFPLTHPFGCFFSMIGPQILRPWNCPLEKNPLEDYIVLSLCWLYTCLTWGNVYKYISLTYYIILLNWHGK